MGPPLGDESLSVVHGLIVLDGGLMGMDSHGFNKYNER